MSSDYYDYQTEAVKVPPQSLQAEQSVLGALIIDNEAWDSVADKLIENDFYRREHKLIFSAISYLAQEQKPFDIVTLAEYFSNKNELDKIGSLPYLMTLANNIATSANITAYANIVREKSILRNLIQVGTQITNSAFNTEGREVSELLENAEKQVFQIAEQGQKGAGFVSIAQLTTQTVNKIERLYELKGAMTGAATGFIDLDSKTSGLQAGDLIIVAGRPSMGKTSISMNMAEYFAVDSKKPVAIFSMEMPADALVMRMISSLGRINQQKVRTGQLDDDDWVKLIDVTNQLATTKLFIDDTPGLSPNEMRARARRLARENGQLGLIVIDYIQLMQSPSSGDNRVQQVSDISRGLKALARELNVPVIGLSQLNRNLEQRPNKRPVMSDLRESGSLEQDADLILFVYRDEVYHENSPDAGIAELIIGKQRNGPLGTVRLSFLKEFTRFENLAENSYYENNEY